MYCTKCGNKIEDSVNFCPVCGHLENEALSFAAPYVNFSDTISICFKKYFKFSGRASASEFWWFFLFSFIINLIATLLFGSDDVMTSLVSLFFMIPQLAVGSRRLHDINKSGWWQLISLTIIGIIVLVIWFISKGNSEYNRFDKEAEEQ